MPNVIVYSQPNCSQCRSTKKYLGRNDIALEEIDVTEDVAAYDLIYGLGFRRAPVVQAYGAFWGGFRPDYIDRLIETDKAVAAGDLEAGERFAEFVRIDQAAALASSERAAAADLVAA